MTHEERRNYCKSIVGQVYGELRVVDYQEGERLLKDRFLCECTTCGRQTSVRKYSLIGKCKNTRYCAECSNKRYTPDRVGEIHGRLTIIARDRKVGNKRHFKARCQCGHVGTWEMDIIREKSHSTECWHRSEAERQYRSEPKTLLECLFRTYRSGAEQRGHKFDLTLEVFGILVKENCHYCGGEPQTTIKNALAELLYNGIDRKDNSKGYLKTNVLPCCTLCNRGKGKMSYKAFKKWIKQLKETKLGV